MNFLKSDTLLSIINFLMMSIAVAALDSQYVILVSLLITILYVFKIKNKYALMVLTVVLFSLSDAAFLQTDPQYVIKKNIVELFDVESANVFFKISSLLVSLFLLFQLEKKILHLKSLYKNLIKVTLIFAIALIANKLVAYKNYKIGEVIYLYVILALLLFRSMQIQFNSSDKFLNYFRSIIPPFFDNGWYRRNKNDCETLSISFSNSQITKKISLFLFFQIISKAISAIYMNKSIFNLIDIIQVNPELIILENYSQIKIIISIFLVGLQYIAQILSFSLFAECAYLVFGFKLNSEFKLSFNTKSYSSFINGILPMQTQFLKEVVLFPLINQSSLSSISSFKFYLKCFLYIFIFGFSLHFARNYFLFFSFNLSSIFIRSFFNDLLYFSLIFIFIIAFRKFKSKNRSFLLILNIFFIFTQGLLIYIKRNFLFTSEIEKMKVILYAFFY